MGIVWDSNRELVRQLSLQLQPFFVCPTSKSKLIEPLSSRKWPYINSWNIIIIINIIVIIIIIIIIIISYNLMPIYNTVAEPIPWA